ncbi:hypothetical protein FQA39_LY06113 [Lamprigera yunnana]|nr:hypothetical protein FQA39_LY06113 [Lamprigera yunnana]
MAVDESMYTRGRDGEGLIFSELIDMLEETDDIPESIAICPPEEPPDADKDSDLADGVYCGKNGEGLIFSELIDMLEETDNIPESIAICPPEEPPDADKDSDLSDEGSWEILTTFLLVFSGLITFDP